MQVGADVEGSILIDGGVAYIVSAFTSTGITAPVTKLKSRCPISDRIAAMEPEWLVKEMNA